MSILSPDLIERVHQLSHEQKRQMKVLGQLKSLPKDIQQLEHELNTINQQFKRRVDVKRAKSHTATGRTGQFKRDITEAERLEAELKQIKAFESDSIEMQFLEEILQLRGELSQTEETALPTSKEPATPMETGYIIFYRTEEGQQLEWSATMTQWCAAQHGTCYPSRVAVEKIFTQLKQHWPDLTLKVGRRSAVN